MPHVLLLAAALHAALGCVHHPRSPAGLMQAEHDWTRALEARDAAALDCLLDDGFQDNAWNGAVRGKADMIAALKQRPAGSVELKDLDVRLERSMGYVRGVAVGPAGPARFIDVFVYRGGHWRAVAAQETPVRGG